MRYRLHVFEDDVRAAPCGRLQTGRLAHQEKDADTDRTGDCKDQLAITSGNSAHMSQRNVDVTVLLAVKGAKSGLEDIKTGHNCQLHFGSLGNIPALEEDGTSRPIDNGHSLQTLDHALDRGYSA